MANSLHTDPNATTHPSALQIEEQYFATLEEERFAAAMEEAFADEAAGRIYPAREALEALGKKLGVVRR